MVVRVGRDLAELRLRFAVRAHVVADAKRRLESAPVFRLGPLVLAVPHARYGASSESFAVGKTTVGFATGPLSPMR